MLRVGMDSKRVRTDKAAQRLAAIAEEHLRRLSPEERANRLQVFHQGVAKIGLAAKSEGPRGTPRNRRTVLRRA